MESGQAVDKAGGSGIGSEEFGEFPASGQTRGS